MTALDRARGVVERAYGLLNTVPYSVLALVARAATFVVFWRSGTTKLEDWAGTLSLFANEYKVPLLPPEFAAQMAATVEISGSVCVLLGLLTRPAVLALLGMVSVIQIFVYPTAWPDHIQWLGFMIFLLARGPGKCSIDALLGGRLWRSSTPAIV